MRLKKKERSMEENGSLLSEGKREVWKMKMSVCLFYRSDVQTGNNKGPLLLNPSVLSSDGLKSESAGH